MIVNSFLESCAGDTRNESWTDQVKLTFYFPAELGQNTKICPQIMPESVLKYQNCPLITPEKLEVCKNTKLVHN